MQRSNHIIIENNRRNSQNIKMAKIFLLCIYLLTVTCQIQATSREFSSIRIIGGSEAPIGSIPYIVSLRHNLKHVCGASIISDTWVLTAAHCVEIDSLDTLSIIAGVHNIRYPESMSQERNISRKIINEDYNDWTMFNDLALLELETPLLLGQEFRTAAIQLAPIDFTASSGFASVSGWGSITGDEESNLIYPATLHTVDVPIVNDTYCQQLYGATEYAESMICAGSEEGGVDFCEGDHGSPLVCHEGDVDFLCGVASWGYGCARPNWPSIYTDVAAFRDWIDQNMMRGCQECPNKKMDCCCEANSNIN